VWIDALGPDRCRSDPCAVCSYWHLKQQALNGGRDKLSPEQLEFVGVVLRRRDVSGGWHQPSDSLSSYELDSPLSALSAEDTAILQSLMNAGHADRVGFMG
jgi:hypothetical protein